MRLENVASLPHNGTNREREGREMAKRQDPFSDPIVSVSLDYFEWSALVDFLESLDSDESLRWASVLGREAGV